MARNYRLLRSLNGRLGYLRRERATFGWRYHFVDKNGKTIWKDLRAWEVKAAKPYRKKKKR